MSPYKPEPESRSYKKLAVAGGLLVLVTAAIAGSHFYSSRAAQKLVAKDSSAAQTPSPTAHSSLEQVSDLQLDTAKNYGNKYSNGVLPVGDNKYITTGAKQGYVYECQANFAPSSQAGAQTRGPWFTNNNTQWDLNKKTRIAGSVTWKPSLSIVVKDGRRVITTNDLPSHITGVFPVSKTDPARIYDANPNTITSQTLSYSLSASPKASATPNCMGGEVGVMLSGVALFNAFDAGGHDAGAWEVQDSCGGHPQNKGEYHYHVLSSCITNIGVKTVIGFALDGYPITGPKIGTNNILTTSDLDECHGITSQINLDGKIVDGYHYVMTQDFPYSVSCFKAAATQPPGQHETTSQGGQAQSKPVTLPPQGQPPR